MKKMAKIKFHQPNAEELQTQKMNKIFQMFKIKQQGITSLLKKYGDHQEQDLNGVFSQKLENSFADKKQPNILKNRRSISLKKSRSKKSLKLPQLSHSVKLNQRPTVLTDRRKKKNSHTIEPVKATLRQSLKMIYSDSRKNRQISNKKEKVLKSNKSRVKKAFDTIEYDDNLINKQKLKGNQEKASNLTISQAAQPLKTNPKNIPQPLSISNNLILSSRNFQKHSDPSDSEEEQIPLAYYERQFKQKMTAQCMEEINFLYFSKNESIKDWSESLLMMFEKHDKEVVGLRKKMRYLEKFDDRFFAIDIYKNE